MRNTSENPSASDYVDRVNRAIDHIIRHLADPLLLDEVARVACFSPFHFHRVFQALMGETLHHFVRRLRLERALHQMAHQPRKSLTEIALGCGFASSSDFTRSFKRQYGTAPSRFDLSSHRRARRYELQTMSDDPALQHKLEGLPPGENPDAFEANIVPLPPRSVAYVRVLDPYRPDVVVDAYRRLMDWADARGFGDRQWIGYMWENPELVPLRDCRYDVGVVIPDDSVRPRGEVGLFHFPAMTVAQVELRGGIDLEQRCLDWLFKTWLPNSGYVPDSYPCFESWIGRPFAHGHDYFEIHAEIPITRR